MPESDNRTLADRRAEIDVLMLEYEQALSAAAAWFAEWKARNSGFRCVRPKNVSHETESA